MKRCCHIPVSMLSPVGAEPLYRGDKYGSVGLDHDKRQSLVSLLLLLILCRAAYSAALSHTGGFRVGGGVHDSYTFPCGLVGSFTSPGIDTR